MEVVEAWVALGEDSVQERETAAEDSELAAGLGLEETAEVDPAAVAMVVATAAAMAAAMVEVTVVVTAVVTAAVVEVARDADSRLCLAAGVQGWVAAVATAVVDLEAATVEATAVATAAGLVVETAAARVVEVLALGGKAQVDRNP